MIYSINEAVTVQALADLRQSVGWNRIEYAYNDPNMNSYAHIAVYDEGKLIGFVDSVSNGVTDAYIQDLMVHPDYQGQGIGTELMNRMISHLKAQNIYMISVIYEPALSTFYKKFGFFEMLSGQLETFKCE